MQKIMSSYKEALRSMLENDNKLKQKTKMKSCVRFEEVLAKKKKKSINRKKVTPYRIFKKNEAITIKPTTLTYSVLSSSEDEEEICQADGRSNNFECSKRDFDCGEDSKTLDESETFRKPNTISDTETTWVKESYFSVSPSVSEYSLGSSSSLTYLSNASNVSMKNISDTQVSDLSYIFDQSSSSSSSSLDSSIGLFSENVISNHNYSLLKNDKKVLVSQPGGNVEHTSTVISFKENEKADSKKQTSSVYEVGTFNNIIYKVSDGCIVVLKQNCPLYFHGAFALSVLHGAVDVLGFELTPESREVELYSLRGSSYLFLENKSTYRNRLGGQPSIRDVLIKKNIGVDVVAKIVQKFHLHDTVVFCKKFSSQKLSFLERHVAQQLLPKVDDSELLCTFRENSLDWNVLKLNEHWDSLIARISSTSKVMLCGGKGVGKSTLLRYMMNKLLIAYTSVFVIDLDPGQPEFFVPGSVSAHVITKPVFGPNYTHLRTPERCVFVRNINISYGPNEYIESVKELLVESSDLAKDIPTIINYMGYSRALGLNLAASVISYVFPTLLVQIESTRTQRNFAKKLTVDVVNEHSKLLSSNGNSNSVLTYDLMELRSMVDENDGWEMQPRTIRELCVLSYFSKILGPNNLSIISSKVPVYKINMAYVSITDGERVQELSVANANLVALCSVSRVQNVFRCYGWGIVRGIDVVNNELFLLTPVSCTELENVDHLLIGSVSLPPAMYMTQDGKQGVVPYVSIGLMSDFNSIPKRSHLHKSKYFV